MKIKFEISFDTEVETIVIPVFRRDLDRTLPPIARLMRVDTKRLQQDFEATKDEALMGYLEGGNPAGKVYLIGLDEEHNAFKFGLVMRRFVHKYRSRLFRRMAIDFMKWSSLKYLPGDQMEAYIEAAVENCLLGSYEIGKFRTEPPKRVGPELENIVLMVTEEYSEMARHSAQKGDAIATARGHAMDLVNAPGNRMTATDLAQAAQAAGQRAGFETTIYDHAGIRQLGLHALLAVNQGSERPPTFTVLDYQPTTDQAVRTVALVGKGVTFDTGGISLKGGDHMWLMKSDMGGAAAVIGAVEVAAQMQLPLRVVGIVPATDNQPDGNAINPGDVIDTFAGKTVEVENTDAEGRLILADGLAYANRTFRPDVLIDVATLTGAAVMALGYHAGALFSHNEDLCSRLRQAGEAAGERVWPLPLWDDYAADIRSDVADLKNLGGKAAGAITAAKFLEAFTNEHPAWAHIDIAGTAFGESEFSIRKSSTAFGVRLLVEYMIGLAASSDNLTPKEG